MSDEDGVHREISHCYQDAFGNGHPFKLRPHNPYDVTGGVVCVVGFAASLASLVALVGGIGAVDPGKVLIGPRTEKEEDGVEEEVSQET